MLGYCKLVGRLDCGGGGVSMTLVWVCGGMAAKRRVSGVGHVGEGVRSWCWRVMWDLTCMTWKSQWWNILALSCVWDHVIRGTWLRSSQWWNILAMSSEPWSRDLRHETWKLAVSWVWDHVIIYTWLKSSQWWNILAVSSEPWSHDLRHVTWKLAVMEYLALSSEPWSHDFEELWKSAVISYLAVSSELW